jgi:hypothetical protein
MARSGARLARGARSLREKSDGELSALFGSWVSLPEAFGAPKRRRLFSPSRVFWLFLSQVLSADRACRETLRNFLGRLALEGRSASPRTAGYCKARRRLRQADLDEAHARVARAVRSEHLLRGLWQGRPVKVLDGSGLSMPDTPENQRLYPQSQTAKRGCSFPVMRVVALFCLGTGVLLHLAKGSLAVGERALFRSLWNLLLPGDVILADRGFCGYAEFYFLRQREVDCVMRAHQRRTVGKTRLKRLGRGDWLVLWHKSKPCPKWPDKTTWRALPDTLVVREIALVVPVPGFRTRAVTIATTLLDPVAFPTEAFGHLYRRRWQAELFLRDIKTTMGMDILRCKTPDMVHKELTMHLIAYNLIRLTMLEAARRRDVPVQTLSFKGTLSTLRQWAPFFLPASRRARNALWTRLLELLATDPLPHRPDRVEPRARKRRPKNYQLLNKPRRLFKEIHHRNRYTKMLS